MTDETPTTVGAAIEEALGAYGELATLGEEVEDEWSYIQDLVESWRSSLGSVSVARGDESLDPAVVEAFKALADEARSIGDPHRAIDWLSTFPQVALLALGERG
jgi:hypothetical protein